MRIIRAADCPVDELVREVAGCVRSGGTVIFPTETVYGIGCAPENDSAIDAIFNAKSRSASKPLALHVTAQQQAEPYVDVLTECAHLAMQRLWPGPVAIIVRRNPRRYARAACSGETISLRCPSDELCQAILDAAGPLAATSANLSGSAAYIGSAEDLSVLPQATLCVFAGPTAFGRESSIIDCTGTRPIMLREGALPASSLFEKLGTSPTVR